MVLDELLKQAVRQSRVKTGKYNLSIGTVKTINGDTCTVDDYEDVRLNAVIADLPSQITVYPKQDSKVIIARLESEDDAFVVGVSEIDRVVIKIDNQLFEMYEGKFTVKNSNADLKEILNSTYNQLKQSIINTPSGPGNFSPADIQAFEQINNKVNELLL